MKRRVQAARLRRSVVTKLAVQASTARAAAQTAMQSAHFHKATAEAFGQRARNMEDAWKRLRDVLPRDLFGFPPREVELDDIDRPYVVEKLDRLPPDFNRFNAMSMVQATQELITLVSRAEYDHFKNAVHLRLRCRETGQFGYAISGLVLKARNVDAIEREIVRTVAPQMVSAFVGAIRRKGVAA